MDFKKLQITEGKYWNVFLHKDQTAIGRVYFWYKGVATDLLEIPKIALEEFYDLGNSIKSAINSAFHPDMYNYLSLNNVTKHLHIHLIPRYAKKIRRFGLEFYDISFGKSYVPNHKFVVSNDILVLIKKEIVSNL